MPQALVVAGARRAGTASMAFAIAGALDLPVRETGPGLALMASTRKARAALIQGLDDASALDDALSPAWLERTLPAPGAVWRLADPFPDAAGLSALHGLLAETPGLRVIGVQRDIAGFIASRRRVRPGDSLMDHGLAWARSTAELDSMQAGHPGQVRIVPLAGFRGDSAGTAAKLGEFLGLDAAAQDAVAKALQGEILGRQGMLDGGTPPGLDELALATPELLLIEQICGPLLARRDEMVDVLRHLRRTPVTLPALLRLRPAAQGGLTAVCRPQEAGLTLECEGQAATTEAAFVAFPAVGLAGRGSFTGRALLDAAAPATVMLHITLVESLSRRPLLAGCWALKPGEESRLSAAFGATHELLDISLRLASASAAPAGRIRVDLDGQFSLKA